MSIYEDQIADGAEEAEPTSVVEATAENHSLLGRLPWRLSIIGAILVTAAASWLVILAYCSLAWLSEGGTDFPHVVAITTGAWLLANGVPVSLGSATVSIVPLGMTVIIMVMAGSCFSAIARAVGDNLFDEPRRDRDQHLVGALTLRMAVWSALIYAVLLLVVSVAIGAQDHVGRALVSGIILGGGVAIVSIGQTLGLTLIGINHGGWMTGIVAGIMSSLSLLLVLGCVALLAGTISAREQFLALHAGLAPGVLGSVLLALGQALWAPNAVIWAMGWMSGAGISLGDNAFTSPVEVSGGNLPGIPIFGVIPESVAPGAVTALLLIAVAAAGALGGIVAVRARHKAGSRAIPPHECPPDLGALIGLVIGVVTGLIVVILAAISSGDMGSSRLVDMGPRLALLVILAPALLGAGGILGGWLTAVFSLPRETTEETDTGASR